MRQIVSRAAAPEGVMDIFAAAGLQKPDISILSDEFLAEVRGMLRRNLAVELLRKLLSGEIQTRRKKNVVQAKSFTAMLEQSIRKYQNRAIETAQVIEEMIALAKDMRRANERVATLKLSEEELAFYDALETNDSAVQVLGDEILRTIAREVTDAVRKNVTIDWTMRENVRAQLRVIIKRILRNSTNENSVQYLLRSLDTLIPAIPLRRGAIPINSENREFHNFIQERVRYLCSVHNKIFLSLTDGDTWSIYDRTP